MTLTTSDLGRVAEELAATLDPADAALHRPRYNVAPRDNHYIVITTRRADVVASALRPARWGFPSDKGAIINARVETAAVRELFRDAFVRRRCVVPADGFFEWTPDHRPFWFHAPSGGLLRLAGLYEFDAAGELVFTVLTTDANATVAPTHDRMPVLLDAAAAQAWLATQPGFTFAPIDAGALIATPVSTRVNSVAHDDPDCLAPPTPPAQLKLF